MPRISTSSWSLHRALGRPPLFGPGEAPQGPSAAAEISLLELPLRLATIGINTLEIVHFHFPSTDGAYLDALRAAVKDAGVELFSVLIDAGDITHADAAQREEALTWIRSWIDVAERVGASHARVVAGYTPVERDGGYLRHHPIIQQSANNLLTLTDHADPLGVRVITENFRETGSRADQLLAILELCEGRVGLCADFGNAKGADKYDELAALFPHADSAHVKAEYDAAGNVDHTELARSLGLLRATSFNGPMSLIFDSPLRPGETEWDNLVILRDLVGKEMNEE
ncbi:MAG: sugar phosphate isomerase/epimerase [Caldilineaceae bacterium]|nr:sugar phosphate isomerase/epimerase [Caldilineaceae bacterium]